MREMNTEVKKWHKQDKKMTFLDSEIQLLSLLNLQTLNEYILSFGLQSNLQIMVVISQSGLHSTHNLSVRNKQVGA